MRKPFLLRIPEDLWDELNRWSQEELRSVNGQIEWILKRAVEERKRPDRRDNEASREKSPMS